MRIRHAGAPPARGAGRSRRGRPSHTPALCTIRNPAQRHPGRTRGPPASRVARLRARGGGTTGRSGRGSRAPRRGTSRGRRGSGRSPRRTGWPGGSRRDRSAEIAAMTAGGSRAKIAARHSPSVGKTSRTSEPTVSERVDPERDAHAAEDADSPGEPEQHDRHGAAGDRRDPAAQQEGDRQDDEPLGGQRAEPPRGRRAARSPRRGASPRSRGDRRRPRRPRPRSPARSSARRRTRPARAVGRASPGAPRTRRRRRSPGPTGTRPSSRG